MYTFCNSPPGGGEGGRLPSKMDGNARWELLKKPFRGTNVFWARLEFFSPLRCTKATTAHQLLLLILPYFFNSEKGDLLLVKLIVKYLLSYCFRLNTLKAYDTMGAFAVELMKCLKWRESPHRGTCTKNAFRNP